MHKTKKSAVVFISYSWDSKLHKDWVKDFSVKLRMEGIDIRLDQWEAAPGDQLPHFMENQIKDSDFVLIICTPEFKKKSEAREGGVGYEGNIVTAEIYTKRNHRKFIPILCTGNISTAIPAWLAGKYFIDLSNKKFYKINFNDLVKTLVGLRDIAPRIGAFSSIAMEHLENELQKAQWGWSQASRTLGRAQSDGLYEISEKTAGDRFDQATKRVLEIEKEIDELKSTNRSFSERENFE